MRTRKTYKIDTLDIDKSRGIGIAVPFNPKNIFTITYTTKEQVKSNLLNFLMTNNGERYFNPDFGADLRNLIFSQMSNLDESRQLLYSKISVYFPNIEIQELEYIPDYNTNTLGIKLKYRINTQEDSLIIDIV
jgi:phage baseplate assembly protein W